MKITVHKSQSTAHKVAITAPRRPLIKDVF